MALRWPDDDHETVEAVDADKLRVWFEQHHETADGAWIWFWKKGSGRQSVVWGDAVDVLLCFGWIDTKIQTIDDDAYVQYVTHRRQGSTWSKVNKDKVAALEEAGLMTDAGRSVIDRAQADGSWDLLTAAEDGVVPDDLAAAWATVPRAAAFYEELTPGQQKSLLAKIYLAKRPETRANWIATSVARLAGGEKPPY